MYTPYSYSSDVVLPVGDPAHYQHCIQFSKENLVWGYGGLGINHDFTKIEKRQLKIAMIPTIFR